MKMRDKSICIFVSKGARPDTYINILSYCLARFGTMNISSVFLLNVFDFPLDREKEKLRLDLIKNNIIQQANSISKGEYLPWDRTNGIFKASLSFEFSNDFIIYDELKELCTEKKIAIRSILYEEIDLELKLILQQTHGDYIFDITGLINRYLIDISLFLSENSYDFYSFEMRKKNMTYNHLDLMHNLNEDDFRYIKLSSELYKVIKQRDFLNLNPSNKDNLHENWIKMIGAAKTEKVIDEIIDYSFQVNRKELMNQIIQISSRWKMIKNNNIKGTLNSNEFYISANKINDSLKDLIFEEFVK